MSPEAFGPSSTVTLGEDEAVGPCIVETATTALLRADDQRRFDARGWLEGSVGA